jgi:hypothetical protein
MDDACKIRLSEALSSWFLVCNLGLIATGLRGERQPLPAESQQPRSTNEQALVVAESEGPLSKAPSSPVGHRKRKTKRKGKGAPEEMEEAGE